MRDVDIKRVYDAPAAADGYRVLVDRRNDSEGPRGGTPRPETDQKEVLKSMPE